MPRLATDYIVVHCTATGDKDVSVDDIRKMHKAQGWSDIGYHWVIYRDGTIRQGRKPEDSVGSHVKGFNNKSLGISLVGGKEVSPGKWKANFTEAQMKSLAELLAITQRKYPNAKILGHRDLSPDKDHDGVIEPHEFIKECPCFNAREFAIEHGLKAAPIGEAMKVKVAADAMAFPETTVA
jgi:N-acetylmuramoyl-L-alanine amidase